MSIIIVDNQESNQDFESDFDADTRIPNLDGEFDFSSDDESKKNLGKKINTNLTNGDMFYELYDDGHKPTTKNYAELVSDWLKYNVLLDTNYDCNKNEWLNNTTSYFCLYAKRIFKQNRNVKRLKFQNAHSAFLNKYLDVKDIPICKCVKCLHLKSLKGE